MSRKQRVIAVVGATGAQGGGLVRAILNDPKKQFRVRAITRNPTSDKANALARLGAEVVKGNIDDEKSMKKAFADAYGAFCVTNFWEHHSPEKEMTQAANMAEAAYYTDVKHVIWSTLEDTREWIPLSDKRMPTLNGRYKVPHFDAKGEANEEFSSRDLPVTYLLTSFFWDNLIHFGLEPKRQADGELTFALPMADKPLPGIAAEDIGKCALGLFRNPDKYVEATVGIAGEHLTGSQFAEQLTRALGETVRYTAIEPDAFRALGFPGAEDLGNMYQFYTEFSDEFCATRDVAQTRTLNPELMSFADWLAVNKDRIPVERIAA